MTFDETPFVISARQAKVSPAACDSGRPQGTTKSSVKGEVLTSGEWLMTALESGRSHLPALYIMAGSWSNSQFGPALGALVEAPRRLVEPGFGDHLARIAPRRDLASVLSAWHLVARI